MSSCISVWIFQTGEPLHCDGSKMRPMRAMNLANALVARGHRVTVWSSAFYHQEKRHRTTSFQRISINKQLDICLIPSPGYRRNISISRFWDHIVLASNLRKQLAEETEYPEVAFVGFPPIEAAYVMARWLEQRGVPRLLDVKDQWPSLLVDTVPKIARPFARLLLWPYFVLSKSAMKRSSGVTAMSQSFLDWTRQFSCRESRRWDRIVPLTSPVDSVDEVRRLQARNWWDQQGVSGHTGLRMIFVGSFSRAFDFDPIFHAARRLMDASLDCQFVICGDGEKIDSLQECARDLDNVLIIEWIDRPKLIVLAERASLAMAPYRNSPDFIASIPNKVIDALQLGLPILSPLQGEVMGLIHNEQVGGEYGEGDGDSLSKVVEMLYAQPEKLQQLSANAKTVFQQRFSFEMVYGGLVEQLEQMVIEDNH